MTSKSPVRSADDIDETALSYAEIKMLATGNTHIKEKMDLDIQVQKLRILKSNYLSEKYMLEDKIIKFYPQTISNLTNLCTALEKDLKTVESNPKSNDVIPFSMKIADKIYTEKAEAGQAIIEMCKTMNSPEAISLGEYRGFKTQLFFDTYERKYGVKIVGESRRDVFLGDDASGNIVRINNGIDCIEEALHNAKHQLEDMQNQYEIAKTELEKPFLQEEELTQKTQRLNVLNALLNVDKKNNEIIVDVADEEAVSKNKKEKDYER